MQGRKNSILVTNIVLFSSYLHLINKFHNLPSMEIFIPSKDFFLHKIGISKNEAKSTFNFKHTY